MQNDDVLIVSATMGTTNPLTPPPGWNLVHSHQEPPQLATYTWYKVANGETGIYTFAQNGFAPLIVVLGVYRGVDTASPISDSAIVGSSVAGDPDPPAVTTAQIKQYVVTHGAVRQTTTFHPPDGFEERADWNSFLSVTKSLADAQRSAAGLYNPPMFDADHDGAWTAGSLALRPVYVDLGLTKTVNHSTPHVGEEIVYTLAVTNHSPVNATGIEITDVFPTGVQFNGSNGSQGTYSESNGIWSVGSLAAGADASITLTADVVGVAEILTIPNPSGIPFENFGYSVRGVDTQWIAVGAHRANSGATESGLVRLFDALGRPTGVISNPTPEVNDAFGLIVHGFGDDRVLISSKEEEAIYLYHVDGTQLLRLTNLTHSTSFGQMLDAVGDRLIVASSWYESTSPDDAAVFLYDSNGVLMVTMTNPSPVSGDTFGYVLEGLGNDRVLVGAPNYDGGDSDDGAVYIYETNGTLVTVVTNPAPERQDYFGWSISAMGTNLFAVGTTKGANAYIYDRNGNLVQPLNYQWP
ncbi:MAG: DUF11 domain-containing protein, partial [Verrucomicrobiota bacterium]